jgi:hypothetical protein
LTTDNSLVCTNQDGSAHNTFQDIRRNILEDVFVFTPPQFTQTMTITATEEWLGCVSDTNNYNTSNLLLNALKTACDGSSMCETKLDLADLLLGNNTVPPPLCFESDPIHMRIDYQCWTGSNADDVRTKTAYVYLGLATTVPNKDGGDPNCCDQTTLSAVSCATTDFAAGAVERTDFFSACGGVDCYSCHQAVRLFCDPPSDHEYYDCPKEAFEATTVGWDSIAGAITYTYLDTCICDRESLCQSKADDFVEVCLQSFVDDFGESDPWFCIESYMVLLNETVVLDLPDGVDYKEAAIQSAAGGVLYIKYQSAQTPCLHPTYCPAGYFCDEGTEYSKRQESLCSEHHHCVRGSSKATQKICPAGTQCTAKGCKYDTSCSVMPNLVTDLLSIEYVLGNNWRNMSLSQWNSDKLGSRVYSDCHPFVNGSWTYTVAGYDNKDACQLYEDVASGTTAPLSVDIRTQLEIASTTDCEVRLDFVADPINHAGTNLYYYLPGNDPLRHYQAPDWCRYKFATMADVDTYPSCSERVEFVVKGRDSSGSTFTQDQYLEDCFDCYNQTDPDYPCSSFGEWTDEELTQILTPKVVPIPTFNLKSFETAVFWINMTRFLEIESYVDPDVTANREWEFKYNNHYRFAAYHADLTVPMKADSDTQWDSFMVDAVHSAFDRNGKVLRYAVTTLTPTRFRMEAQILHGAFSRFRDYFHEIVNVEILSPRNFGGEIAGGVYLPYRSQTYLSVVNKLTTLALPLNAPIFSDLNTQEGQIGYSVDPDVQLPLEYRNTKLFLSPWSDPESSQNVSGVFYYQEDLLLQALSQVKPVADRYWTTGITQVPMTYLPFVMQCDPGIGIDHDGDLKPLVEPWNLTGSHTPGWDKQIPLYMLMENPYGCLISDPADPLYQSSVYGPFDFLAPRPKYADTCHYRSVCHYYEDMRVTDTYPKWYEATTKQAVFYISDRPVTEESVMGDINKTATVGDSATAIGFPTIVGLHAAQRLVWVRAKTVGFADGAIPTKVAFRIRYYQETFVSKVLVRITMTFEEFYNPDDATLPESIVNQYFIHGDTSQMRGVPYNFSFHYEPLSWLECLDFFGLPLMVYIIVYMAIGGMTVAGVIVIWILGRLLAAGAGGSSGLHFKEYMKEFTPAPIKGFLYSAGAMGIVAQFVNWCFLTGGAESFKGINAQWNQQAFETDLEKLRFAGGRAGLALAGSGQMLLVFGAGLLVPFQDNVKKGAGLSVYRPYYWQRSHILFLSVIATILVLFVVEFS